MSKKVLTLAAAIVAALAVAALAGASGRPVHRACFGVQWFGASGSGSISHGDVNTLARQRRVCIVGRRGPRGRAGKNGATGPQGPAGKDGAVGPQGPQGPQGEPGCIVRKIGVLYKPGVVFCGDPGPQGPKGDTGATGPVGPVGPEGPQGPAGPAGTDGLGNGTMVICLDGKGGINAAPCQGNQTAVTVVIVTGS